MHKKEIVAALKELGMYIDEADIWLSDSSEERLNAATIGPGFALDETEYVDEIAHVEINDSGPHIRVFRNGEWIDV